MSTTVIRTHDIRILAVRVEVHCCCSLLSDQSLGDSPQHLQAWQQHLLLHQGWAPWKMLMHLPPDCGQQHTPQTGQKRPVALSVGSSSRKNNMAHL